jgi:hypothetical protein
MLGTKSVIYLVVNERAALTGVTYYIKEDPALLNEVVFV